MGEAIYYMKVYCKSEKEAEALLPKLQAFFEEGRQAEDYWQENRDEKKSREDFWKEFAERFPLVTEYVNTIREAGGDKNNSLAGNLDFGEEDSIQNMSLGEPSVIYYNSMVWHFAQWDPLADFIKVKFSEVEKVAWLSDEYMQPFDLL